MASPDDSLFCSTAPYLLSVRDIASWQIPHLASTTPMRATLPALQRGAVWKVRQTEALWDSLVRGFPIGSFLVSPLDTKRGSQEFRFNRDPAPELPATHHLLDGQQRATALALGFLDSWQHSNPSDIATLWVDLAPPPANDDRDYVFRVLTRSHPWGYRLSQPDTRLEARQMRAALEAYKKASPQFTETRPANLPLTHTWPWDAKAPVPVPLLIDAIKAGGDTAAKLLELLAVLPFWQNGHAVNAKGDWQKRIVNALTGTDTSLRERFDQLVARLHPALGDSPAYRVPVIVVPPVAAAARPDAQETATRQDPIETLFIRVNAGGTRLEGEELMYSVLKAIWPEAPKVINRLANRLATPSRLVMLIARLVLAEDAKGGNPPPTPDVRRFRRLVHGADAACPDFYRRLQGFVDRDASLLFDLARELLTSGNYGLPPVLSADLARRSPDVMFLFLHWLRRLQQTGHDPRQLDEGTRRRMLGVLTALSWFARDSARCLNVLWENLCDDQLLPGFFSRQNLGPLLKLTGRGDFHLPPIPCPGVLKDAIDHMMLSPAEGGQDGLDDPSHRLWKEWRWYENFASHLTKRLSEFYDKTVGSFWLPHAQNDDGEKKDNDPLTIKYREAWTAFIDKLRGERRLLLYAQRGWLSRWFDDYDPTAPDQLEDTDRPWDFDHIHPESFIRRRRDIPRIIRNWHSSIGNLRAWPMEVNRSDGARTPSDKLMKITDVETLARYGLDRPKIIRDASHVRDDWPHWQACTPSSSDHTNYPSNYLADPVAYGACRPALIRAITTRFVNLYAEWYRELHVGDWMGCSCSNCALDTANQFVTRHGENGVVNEATRSSEL